MFDPKFRPIAFGRREFTIAITSVMVGAVMGSVVTFFLPIIWESWTSKPNPEEFLRVSPTQISEWYLKQDTEMEAQILARSIYYGRWVQWKGTIEDVSEPAAAVSFSDSVYVLFREWIAVCPRDQVSGLKKGMDIIVTGKIHLILSSGIISVGNCTITGTRPKNDAQDPSRAQLTHP